MPKTHVLKTDPQPFDDIVAGRKTFEIRQNDRDYQVGDTLELRKTRHTGAAMAQGAPLEFIGQPHRVTVSHIMRGPAYGLAQDWCIMSIDNAANADKARLREDNQKLAKHLAQALRQWEDYADAFRYGDPAIGKSDDLEASFFQAAQRDLSAYDRSLPPTPPPPVVPREDAEKLYDIAKETLGNGCACSHDPHEPYECKKHQDLAAYRAKHPAPTAP